jgi:hypothetical protein
MIALLLFLPSTTLCPAERGSVIHCSMELQMNHNSHWLHPLDIPHAGIAARHGPGLPHDLGLFIDVGTQRTICGTQSNIGYKTLVVLCVDIWY